jgi:hypothetical protein
LAEKPIISDPSSSAKVNDRLEVIELPPATGRGAGTEAGLEMANRTGGRF